VDSTLHDTSAESELSNKLHASNLVVLHEHCPDNTSCMAKPGGIKQRSEEGLTAPGVKLYVHREKWQDSSMCLYSEDEDDEDEEPS